MNKYKLYSEKKNELHDNSNVIIYSKHQQMIFLTYYYQKQKV